MTDTNSRRKLQARLAEAHDLALAVQRNLLARGLHLPKDHPLNRLVQLLSAPPDKARVNMVEAAEMRLDGKSWLDIENAMHMDTSNYRKRDRLKPAFDEVMETLRFLRDPNFHQGVYERRNKAYQAAIRKRRK